MCIVFFWGQLSFKTFQEAANPNVEGQHTSLTSSACRWWWSWDAGCWHKISLKKAHCRCVAELLVLFLGTGRRNHSPNYQLVCLFVRSFVCSFVLFVCLFVSWLISTLWSQSVSLRLISWCVVSSWILFEDHLQETVCLWSVTPNQPTNQPGK